jgi:hypothetical protein
MKKWLLGVLVCVTVIAGVFGQNASGKSISTWWDTVVKNLGAVKVENAAQLMSLIRKQAVGADDKEVRYYELTGSFTSVVLPKREAVTSGFTSPFILCVCSGGGTVRISGSTLYHMDKTKGDIGDFDGLFPNQTIIVMGDHNVDSNSEAAKTAKIMGLGQVECVASLLLVKGY